MMKDTLLDELRRIESEVVEGERQLAEQEAMLLELRRGKQDMANAEAVLQLMREHQQQRDQARQRLLSLLQR
jgi:hypothetical protein